MSPRWRSVCREVRQRCGKGKFSLDVSYLRERGYVTPEQWAALPEVVTGGPASLHI
jgi:hypothetical protein